MLVVHPSSQCDVCLDAYTWPTKVPHAIQCGHVFCHDCLRTVNPSNCPMCRKAFNPDRIKKLHVDKAPSDGTTSSGPVTEENAFLRRVGILFGEDADEEDVNALVEEVTEWSAQNAGPTHRALRNAITALHQYKALQMQNDVDKETIERLRVTHERHAHVKQKDLDIAMVVERNMLLEQEKMRDEYEEKVAKAEAELAALHEQNARIQAELDRYTTTSNPLPRPPEIIPLVTSLTREHAAASTRSARRGTDSLGLGAPPAVVQAAAAAPTSQSRSSSGGSGGSRGRAPSVHFADPAPSRDPKARYRVTTDGEELRQEMTQRPHLVVPGAPSSKRVIPPRLDGPDSDITPRPPAPATELPPISSLHWPSNFADCAPPPGESVFWVGAGTPREITASQIPSAVLPRRREPPPDPNPVTSTAAPSSSAIPPVIPPPPVPPSIIAPPIAQTARAAAETGSARIRVPPPDVPVSGRSPLAWRPGPAHKEGYVVAYLPEIGISWIPEEQAAKLPVRARGTECRFAYVIAKEPSEVDDEWRRDHNGASPLSNPLRLIGVPEAPVAGPSTSVVQNGQYNSLPGASTARSALFSNPFASERTIAALANNSNASPSGMGVTMPTSSARLNRTSTRHRSASNTVDPLGLNIPSLPEPGVVLRSAPEEPEVQPSPASTWGTVPSLSSRNSSLGNLRLNNLPSPHPFARASESLEQLPIGELNGGPIVLTDVITPRQGSSVLEDNRSLSDFSTSSHDRNAVAASTGLLLNPSAGSSRQVVTSLRDLEDINRSLSQLASFQGRDGEGYDQSEPSHASRHASSRHSRQPSLSGDEPDHMVGLRTGLTLYSSRPMTNSSGSRSSIDPSPPAQSRPRSGASTRSYAESTYSHHSAHSNHSAHSSISRRPSDHRRARRGSTASALDSIRDHEPAVWTTAPSDLQPYGSSRGPYTTSDSRSQKSHESIPRSVGAMDGLGTGPTSMSSLLLNFEAPSTSSAVTGNGEEAAGIHAPRPVNGRRSSMFGNAWNARSGH